MTALQNLLKYTKLDKAGFVDDESEPDSDSSQLDETPTEEDSVKEAQALLDATEDRLGPAQQAAFDRQSKYTKDKNEPGVLSRDVSALWNLGLESAEKARAAAEGNMPTDSLTAKPGVKPPKTGGGGSSNVSARPARLPPTASTSSQVTHQRMQQAKLPVGVKMEKDYVNDKYEKEFGEQDIPDRKTKDHMKVSGKGVQNLQKLIGERAQQIKNKRGN